MPGSAVTQVGHVVHVVLVVANVVLVVARGAGAGPLRTGPYPPRPVGVDCAVSIRLLSG